MRTDSQIQLHTTENIKRGGHPTQKNQTPSHLESIRGRCHLSLTSMDPWRFMDPWQLWRVGTEATSRWVGGWAFAVKNHDNSDPTGPCYSSQLPSELRNLKGGLGNDTFRRSTKLFDGFPKREVSGGFQWVVNEALEWSLQYEKFPHLLG